MFAEDKTEHKWHNIEVSEAYEHFWTTAHALRTCVPKQAFLGNTTRQIDPISSVDGQQRVKPQACQDSSDFEALNQPESFGGFSFGCLDP